MTSEKTHGVREELVMHVKLPVHTWKLRTTECPDTALFIFHASQRESREADKGKKQTHTHIHRSSPALEIC